MAAQRSPRETRGIAGRRRGCRVRPGGRAGGPSGVRRIRRWRRNDSGVDVGGIGPRDLQQTKADLADIELNRWRHLSAVFDFDFSSARSSELRSKLSRTTEHRVDRHRAEAKHECQGHSNSRLFQSCPRERFSVSEMPFSCQYDGDPRKTRGHPRSKNLAKSFRSRPEYAPHRSKTRQRRFANFLHPYHQEQTTGIYVVGFDPVNVLSVVLGVRFRKACVPGITSPTKSPRADVTSQPIGLVTGSPNMSRKVD